MNMNTTYEHKPEMTFIGFSAKGPLPASLQNLNTYGH